MNKTPLQLAVVLVMPWLAAQVQAVEPGALWQIGEADNNTAEAGCRAGRRPFEDKNQKARAMIDITPFEIVTLRSEF